jgi:hypothetical protein
MGTQEVVRFPISGLSSRDNPGSFVSVQGPPLGQMGLDTMWVSEEINPQYYSLRQGWEFRNFPGEMSAT